MIGVVRKVRKSGLVDVENPSVVARICVKVEALGVEKGLIGHNLWVLSILFAKHVVPHVVLTLFWDGLPPNEVVGLDAESPAQARPDDVAAPAAGAAAPGAEEVDLVGYDLFKTMACFCHHKEDHYK